MNLEDPRLSRMYQIEGFGELPFLDILNALTIWHDIKKAFNDGIDEVRVSLHNGEISVDAVDQ